MNEPQITAEIEKRFSKIMLEWIESQWKIEQAHQNGEPYTRMKFEADANKVEKKLKHFIATAITQERNKVIELLKKFLGYHCDEPNCDHNLEEAIKVLNQLKGKNDTR